MPQSKEYIRLAADLQTDSIVDGPGLRAVIWTQGCHHNCKGCHNPTTHDFNGGGLVPVSLVCEAIDELEYHTGITFSGGDPLERAAEFAYMAKAFKKAGLNIWCYTGYTFENVLEMMKKDNNIRELIENIDVLVDGRFEKDKKVDGLKFRGSNNQRIIDVKMSLKGNCIVTLE